MTVWVNVRAKEIIIEGDYTKYSIAIFHMGQVLGRGRFTWTITDTKYVKQDDLVGLPQLTGDGTDIAYQILRMIGG